MPDEPLIGLDIYGVPETAYVTPGIGINPCIDGEIIYTEPVDFFREWLIDRLKDKSIEEQIKFLTEIGEVLGGVTHTHDLRISIDQLPFEQPNPGDTIFRTVVRQSPLS